jgi:predicted nucleic acid-binding protein
MMHYILDSSVIVKWFNHKDEDNVNRALKLMDLFGADIIGITIPDLAIYEIANALRYNKNFDPEEVKKIISTLMELQLNIINVEEDLINSALDIAVEDDISIYDAIFISISEDLMMPLVTANPRHHMRSSKRNIINIKDIKL